MTQISYTKQAKARPLGNNSQPKLSLNSNSYSSTKTQRTVENLSNEVLFET